MDISFLSIFIFIIITLIYYNVSSLGKTHLLYENLIKPDGYNLYLQENRTRMGLYFLAIVVSQFLLNSLYLINKCGGDAGKNVGAAALFTFIPWVFIFGILIIILILFPGFKNAFSNVIGYFFVANGANNLLSKILINSDIQSSLNNIQQSNDNSETKNQLEKTSEAIMKIFGNKSLLINIINPENFLDSINILTPLMKNEYKNDNKVFQELLDLVMLKDNIGEAMWYVYSALLIISIVYYNLATRGCIKSVDSIKNDYNKYLEEQEQKEKQKELAESTVYTINPPS